MPKLSLAVRIALATLLIFLPLQGMDQWFYDHLFRLAGRESRPTPFVLIRVSDKKIFQLLESEQGLFPKDEISIERSSHPVWHQAFYETLLEKIQGTGPQLVVFTSFYEWLAQRKP